MKRNFILKILSLCLCIFLLSACSDKAEQPITSINTLITNTTQTTEKTLNTTTPEPTKPAETVKPSESTEPSKKVQSTEPTPTSSQTKTVDPTPVITETKPASQAKPEQSKQEQPKQEPAAFNNNIKGVKVIDFKNDIKNYWSKFKQDQITFLEPYRVWYYNGNHPIYIAYENLDCVTIRMDNWNDIQKDLVKTILKNTVENSEIIYNQADKIFTELKSSNSNATEEWKKENYKTFYTGDVKYTINYYSIQCENIEQKNNIAISKDGIMTSGVLKENFSLDFSKNSYLINFMKENFAEGTYKIEAGGAAYSSTHTNIKTTSYATIFSTPDNDLNSWNIYMQKFGDNEKTVLKAILKTLTADADAVYEKFAEMAAADGTMEEIESKYKYETWQKTESGNTLYTYGKNTQYVILRIKY